MDSPTYSEQNVSKVNRKISGGMLILAALVLCLLWVFYIGSLNDLPADVKNAEGVQKYAFAIFLSFLFVILVPFAGFSYSGDTLAMIVSTIIATVFTLLVLRYLISSLLRKVSDVTRMKKGDI